AARTAAAGRAAARRLRQAPAWSSRQSAGDEPWLAPDGHVAIPVVGGWPRGPAGVRIEEDVDGLARVLRQVEGDVVPAPVARIAVRVVDDVVDLFRRGPGAEQHAE